jgi:hypothetical protein
MRRLCPYCNQALPEIRLGVRMPDLKAHIFDLIMRSGNAGIAADTLSALAYTNGYSRHETRSGKTIAAHIHQINELIEDAGYRIVSRERAYYLKNLNGARR